MKIIQKEKDTKAKNQISTNSWDATFDDNNLVIELGNSKILIIEGDLYYCQSPDGKIHHTHDAGFEDEIKRLASQNTNISSFLEGMYVAALVDQDDDSVTVMSDSFANIDMFYHECDQNCIASTKIHDIIPLIKNIEYQQEVLYCMLILGYPPAKYTPYKTIRRIAYDEHILFKDGNSTVIRQPIEQVPICPMQDKDLERYGEIFKNSVISKANDIENWVMISGGWDSNIMLATLCKYTDKNKIKPIVARLMLPDGRCYNPYEVSKSEKIAKYHGLECVVVDAWLGHENTCDHIRNISPNLRSHLLFDWMPAFYSISKFIEDNGKEGASVFYGGFSDALHNFGFSQYSSLPYLTYDFREYSDKMRSYLYSPSFLKKVQDQSHEDDFIYKLFRWHTNSEEDFVTKRDTNDAILNYLLSFVISDLRIPFASIATDAVFKDGAKEQFKQWLYENFFRDVVENINSENMYFYLIHLYKYFHLQGSQHSVIQSSFEGTGCHPSMPYLDGKLAEFLAAMPEDWGRGLEWKQIKYPLKQYAHRYLDVPVDIIESDFHSYIDEKEDDERLIDWRSEMINKSPLGLNCSKLSEQKIVDKIFDEHWFDRNLIKAQLSNPANASTSKFHLNLATFLTVGLEGV